MNTEKSENLPAEQKPDRTRKRLYDVGALSDLVLIMATMVIVKQSLLPYSVLYAGPASTFSAMALATYLLKRRGLSWFKLGLRWPESWLKTMGLAVLTFIAFVTAMQLMGLLADLFFVDVGASGRFDHIEGNLPAYLLILFFIWTHASFFEELLFRAFIINRASDFLGGGLAADLLAALVSAIFFGYRHYYYQGMHGALTTGAAGLVFALFYLWFGRKNILPLVLSHGVANTLSQTFRFLGIKGD